MSSIVLLQSRGLTTQLSDSVNVWSSTQPDTLRSEIYLLVDIHFKCVAVLFRLSPESKAYNGYQSHRKVLWINSAANITFFWLSHLKLRDSNP